MLGIVVSRADEASIQIGEQLREIADWAADHDSERTDAAGGSRFYRTSGAELRLFDAIHLQLERPAEAFDETDLIVFASRHSGETGALLTAHHTGNVGPAEYGGNPNSLADAAPEALATALAAAETHAPGGYDVGLESTHHGPSDVGAPSLFVEVGSAEPQWRDTGAAAAAARTILALRDVEPRTNRAFVGFGGGHYAPRFTRIVKETDWRVGHIVADWSLRAARELDDRLIHEIFKRSGASAAVVEGDRPIIEDRIGDLGYRVVRESWLRETTGVTLDLVDRLEAELLTVDNGLRFGETARMVNGSATVELVRPDENLLADVNGIDADRVREAVARETIAYETVEAGNRVNGRVAIREPESWDRIEATLFDLLDERYFNACLEPGAIVVTEEVFDPDRARKLGVEPGPAFGELADGEPVTVDGELIRPEAVHETRTRRYSRP